jgi:hypothetical protein
VVCVISFGELGRVAPINTAHNAHRLLSIRSLNRQASGWNLPRGKHILFAACQDLEVAKEYKVDGEYRGAFCYFLTKTLSQTQGNLTYRDLFKRTDALPGFLTRFEKMGVKNCQNVYCTTITAV